MLWIIENMATIVICLVLACIAAAIIVNQVKKKKRGEGSCGCGCSHCSMDGMCHNKCQVGEALDDIDKACSCSK